MSDFPLASDHHTPSQYWFNYVYPIAIVIHETGGDRDLPSLFNTFNNSDRSAHYGIGTDDQGVDGACWQFVPETNGAGANCCPDPGHDPFWDPLITKYGNLNLCTLSVEHCNDLNNDKPLTPKQIETSFKLVAYWVNKYKISLANIKGHSSINPSRNCPGPYYPWAQLMSYLKGGSSVNVQQRRAFEAEWTALVPTARLDSGIANAAWADYQAGVFRGPALELEQTHDRSGNLLTSWGGEPLVRQICVGGRYEWVNGQPHFYPYA